MVRLDTINKICAKRRLANSVPAQGTCRILGNEASPCQIDKFCRIVENQGMLVFYSALGAGVFAGFTVVFWILRVTRLSRVLSFFLGLLVPPIKWTIKTINSIKEFWNSLPD